MTRSNKLPHYSDAGITLMSQVFEQQMRFAHLMGAAALSGNPFFARPSADRKKAKPLPGNRRDTGEAVKRTYSMPV